jgi:hypothetical protein
LWVSYQNGSDSTGVGGASTVARYSLAGSLINTWTIAGNVDGLRIDPAGQVWALQNNDGNSALTVINPVTNATIAYTYGDSFTNSANRGFDDAEFLNGQAYLSETNPASGGDPVIVRLTTQLASPLQIAGILNSTFTGAKIASGAQQSTTITDSDSLILDPSGDLVLTGEGDREIVFVRNPGALNQSQSFLACSGRTETPFPAFPTIQSSLRRPTVRSTYPTLGPTLSTRSPLQIWLPDRCTSMLAMKFGALNTSTGIVTPLFTGVSPHGVVFVASPNRRRFFSQALRFCWP